MNSAESLMSAVQWSGPRTGTRRKGASLDSLLIVLALVILATAAVVLAATPAETPLTLDSGGTSPAVGLSGNELAFESTGDDPVNGAWNGVQAEWSACQESDLPNLLCTAERVGATP